MNIGVRASSDRNPRRTGQSGRRFWDRLKEHPLARVGPGLIAGVADDDPSGIATYSQAGAQFGLNMLWTMPLVYPLMAAIQSLCARIGRVTGKGLAANIGIAFPPLVLQAVVFLLLLANTLNIAADVAAMGETAELVTGFNRHLMTALFVVVTVLLQVFVPYHRYVRFLKWLTLSLLAYAAVLFTVHVPWGEVFRRTLWPHFAGKAAAAAVIVGVFGTTISPYLFFWQASGRSKTCAPVRRPLRCSRTRRPPTRSWVEFGGIPGAACCRECTGRAPHSVFADQPNEGTLLERRHQWCRCRPTHGCNPAAGRQEVRAGCVHRKPVDPFRGLDGHARHGSSRRMHVDSLTRTCAPRPELSAISGTPRTSRIKNGGPIRLGRHEGQ